MADGTPDEIPADDGFDQSTDAMVWAQALVKRWPFALDSSGFVRGSFQPAPSRRGLEELMVTWFANAIERGRDAGASQATRDAVHSVPADARLIVIRLPLGENITPDQQAQRDGLAKWACEETGAPVVIVDTTVTIDGLDDDTLALLGLARIPPPQPVVPPVTPDEVMGHLRDDHDLLLRPEEAPDAVAVHGRLHAGNPEYRDERDCHAHPAGDGL